MQPTHQIPLKKLAPSMRLSGTTDPVWSSFYSHEIPSTLILNAFHLEELHMLKKRITSKSFKDEDASRLNLQIRGQEVPSLPDRRQLPEVITRNRTLYNSNIKKIRTFLSNQQAGVIQTLTCEDESAEIREKFEALKKYHQAKLAASSPTKQPVPKLEQKQPEQTQQLDSKSTEYYERLILETPVLFNRIVTAYNKQKYETPDAMNRSLKPKTRASIHKRRSVPCVIQSEAVANPDLVKLQRFKELNFIMALSNNLVVGVGSAALTTEYSTTYKAYICKGNNGVLVKGLLKSRPWWSVVSLAEVASANLTWTEWKRTKSFELLRSTEKSDLSASAPFQEPSSSRNEKIGLIGKLLRLEQYDTLRSTIRPRQFISMFSFSKKLAETANSGELVQKHTSKPHLLTTVDAPQNQRLLNHFEGGLHLHSKKLLYLNLKQYYKRTQRDVWEVLPVTYIIRNGCDDSEFSAFAEHFRQIQLQLPSTQRGLRSEQRRSHNIWICKPGENSNRGNGIYLHDSLEDIRSLVRSRQGSNRSLIVQKYIDYPFLYQRRKFDLRCYLLLTCYNGILKAYWFDEGYIRTSSREFTLKHLDNRIIHLTNDAVQKRSDDYGRFESSNKISLADFQKYLDAEHPSEKYSVAEIFARMKQIATDIVRSVEHVLNPRNRQFCFELFGLDFMIDSKFRPLLIEANSNPCLEVSGLVLGRLIPQLIQNVLRLAVDPLFPPPDSLVKGSKKLGALTTIETNKFELIFDQQFQSQPLPAHSSPRLITDLEEEEQPDHE